MPVTQEELAAATLQSRNTTGAILRRFAAEGLVETAYRSLIVKAPARLRDRAKLS